MVQFPARNVPDVPSGGRCRPSPNLFMHDIGLIGLAVMGQNLVRNMENKGFSVAVHNRTTATMEEFLRAHGQGKRIEGFPDLPDFVASLARPRKIMIMVKAGAPVDAVIDGLLPLLEEGDLIIDGGNSLFTDTERRASALEARGLRYLGTGVSGGEEGALNGPSIMPGGTRGAWDLIAPIFRKIAAQVEGEPCCRYMGPGGAGHYVKMVHNGIEYGDMQLICEAYALLAEVGGLQASELADVFTKWNEGDLNSYLIEITSQIFSRIDPETGKPMVDMILDKAGQKGTGKWTIQSALDMGIVVSTINAAVEARVLSSLKDERVAASAVLPARAAVEYEGDRAELIDSVRQALYASKIVSYAQGMALMGAASSEHQWGLNFGDIATIWRGGCIIRASFLHRITEAYTRDAGLESLMLDRFFCEALASCEAGWRKAVGLAVAAGIPAPAFAASLAYFDGYRSARLPANLLQAQRDFFGAHTYERVDKPGVFHTEWLS